MHYRARSYDPRSGRFVQKDPILDNIVKQHFAYAENSPTFLLDPRGRQAKDPKQDFGFQGGRRRVPHRVIAVYVEVQDPAGLVDSTTIRKFRRIMDKAILSVTTKTKVSWIFSVNSPRNLTTRFPLGKVGKKQFLYKVTQQPGPAGFSGSMWGSTARAFDTVIYSDNIRDFVRKHAPTETGLIDTTTFTANTLVHEIGFHGIGRNVDNIVNKEASETGKPLDLSMGAPARSWARKEGFFPPKATLDMLKKLGHE